MLLLQVQVDLGTPSALTATLRRNLMEFFDENHKEFVPGGGTVIYLDSQDPLKMTLGVVYTFSHNGALLAALSKMSTLALAHQSAPLPGRIPAAIRSNARV